MLLPATGLEFDAVTTYLVAVFATKETIAVFPMPVVTPPDTADADTVAVQSSPDTGRPSTTGETVTDPDEGPFDDVTA